MKELLSRLQEWQRASFGKTDFSLYAYNNNAGDLHLYILIGRPVDSYAWSISDEEPEADREETMKEIAEFLHKLNVI